MKAPWFTPLLRNLRVSSAGMMMVSIFCNSQDIIMVVYLDEGRTIKGAYYTEELRPGGCVRT